MGIIGVVTIPGSVTSIGHQAFYGCTGLTAVTIPGSVTSIDYNAFSGCTALTAVTIPESVTSIDWDVFSGCTGLTAITVAAGNASYSSLGGILYDKLQHTLVAAPVGIIGVVTIPGSVTSISDAAFYGCTGLTAVTIPGSVTSIGGGAFSGCTGLTSVTIPSSVTSIGYAAFYGCTGLTAITVDAGNPSYSSNAGVLYNKSQTTLIQCPGGLTSVTIPSSVTSIGGGAFSVCTGLTSVTIPSSVTSIGDDVFSNCSGLTELNFLGAPPQLGGTLSNINTTIVKYPKGSGATTWASYVGTLFGGLITQEST